MERRSSEACARNTAPIGDVLEDLLPASGIVLEIGCGTGEHAAAFARRFPHLTWQATDRADSLGSVRAWREVVGAINMAEPKTFNLFDDAPPLPRADAIFSANVLHIAPAEASERLFFHARRLLPIGGRLIVYGPFRYQGIALEPSNEAFDAHLRARDPSMGLRVAEELDALAEAEGLRLAGDIEMPANNRIRFWEVADF